jgi:hypothetical protein
LLNIDLIIAWVLDGLKKLSKFIGACFGTPTPPNKLGEELMILGLFRTVLPP